MFSLSTEYKEWLAEIEIKNKMRFIQAKTAFAVNSALTQFYWETGLMISERQSQRERN